MRIVIHQPYFLPWLGFFSKILHSDGYVALDDVNFRKRHFQDRVQIISMTGDPKWIGIPVGENLGIPLNRVEVSSLDWINRISRTIEHSYARSKHISSEWPPILSNISKVRQGGSLADVNIFLIGCLLGMLTKCSGSTYNTWKSSEIPYEGDATDRIIAICKHVGASSILIGNGASMSSEVHDIVRLRRNGIEIYLQDFLSADISYFQIRRQMLSFLPGVSSIDAILNIGSDQTAKLLMADSLNPIKVEF